MRLKNRLSYRRLHAAAAILLTLPILLFCALAVGIALQKVTQDTGSVFYPRKYNVLVENASLKWGVPESVIYGVIHTESGFDEHAVSRANAIGLMQITADTYDWIAFLQGEEFDPETIAIPSYNINAGVFLLAWLYRQYGRWDTVYAAYNAGYARVNRWLEDPEITENGILVNIPITETAAYVQRCTQAEQTYRTLYYQNTEQTN